PEVVLARTRQLIGNPDEFCRAILLFRLPLYYQAVGGTPAIIDSGNPPPILIYGWLQAPPRSEKEVLRFNEFAFILQHFFVYFYLEPGWLARRHRCSGSSPAALGL